MDVSIYSKTSVLSFYSYNPLASWVLEPPHKLLIVHTTEKKIFFGGTCCLGDESAVYSPSLRVGVCCEELVH